MVLNGRRSLRNLFVRYIIYFIFSTILLFLFMGFGFEFMLKKNIVFPANYFEKRIEQNSDELVKAERITKNLIPEGCGYGVYNKEGGILYGSFKVREFQESWKNFKNDKMNSGINHYYKIFYRNNEICIVKYPLSVQFTNLFLRKYFPDVENMAYIFILLIFIMEVLLLSAKFSRYFSKEMGILMKVTERIKNQNLDFNPQHSQICEIDEVINSLDDMKKALKDSLEKQWNMEKTRKDQISSLAHDIKTPLTIIRGNAELIKENCSDGENMKYNQYILESASEIQHYLMLLIGMIKSENNIVFNPVRIDTEAFFKKIESQGKILASKRNIQFISDKEGNIPGFFYGDEELLYRAIVNVISNAVEYSPEKGKILFKAERNDNMIKFLVKDSGRGFSKEELQLAGEQFYRGDSSRNSKDHYGMGLFIVKSVMKLHKGHVKLSNSEITGGALVTLEIPLNPIKC